MPVTPCSDPSISVPAAGPGAVVGPTASCAHPLHPTQIRYVCHSGLETLLQRLFQNVGCSRGIWLLSGSPQLLVFFLPLNCPDLVAEWFFKGR